MTVKKLTIAIAACLFLLAAQLSKAISYSLDLGDSAVGNGNYGTVTVNLVNSTTADITFTANPGFQFVDGGSVAVNVNAGAFTESLLSSDPTGTFSSNGQLDGFGIFNLVLSQANSSPSDRYSSIAFEVDNTSGNWTSDANVLSLNNGTTGFLLGGHIIEGNGPLTGFVSTDGGSPTPPAVPDGGTTIIMLGSALAGFGVVGRRVRKS